MNKTLALKIDWERGMIMYKFAGKDEAIKAVFSLPQFQMVQGEERVLLRRDNITEPTDIPETEMAAMQQFTESLGPNAHMATPEELKAAQEAAQQFTKTIVENTRDATADENKAMQEVLEQLPDAETEAEEAADEICAAVEEVAPYVDEEFETDEEELEVEDTTV